MALKDNRRAVVELAAKYGFVLHRETKHYIFKHASGKILVTSKSSMASACSGMWKAPSNASLTSPARGFFIAMVRKSVLPIPSGKRVLARVSFDHESSVLKTATLADSCERSLDLLLLRRKAAARASHSN